MKDTYLKGRLVKSKTKNLLLITIFILSLMITTAGCTSKVAGESKTFGDSVLDLGYENCLVCHVGGKKPLAEHCTIALDDPVTLNNCLECHLDMRSIMLLPRKDAYIDNCAKCHLEFR